MQGKEVTKRYDDKLVDAAVELLQRWRPSPSPEWITAVPSRSGSELLFDFAQRLAARLSLPLVRCIEASPDTPPQKQMLNSAQQLKNAADTYTLSTQRIPRGPVLLLDDLVDSRWTQTLIAAMLRRNGSGPVFPLALASAGRYDD